MDCERADQKKPVTCTVCKQEKRRSDFKPHVGRHINDSLDTILHAVKTVTPAAHARCTRADMRLKPKAILACSASLRFGVRFAKNWSVDLNTPKAK